MRRRALTASLVPYAPIVDAWAQWQPPAPAVPAWSGPVCEERWRRGVPLLAESRLDVTAADVEDLLAVAMEAVTATRPEEAAGMRRLADEWDAGRLDLAAFLPTPGAIG